MVSGVCCGRREGCHDTSLSVSLSVRNEPDPRMVISGEMFVMPGLARLLVTIPTSQLETASADYAVAVFTAAGLSTLQHTQYRWQSENSAHHICSSTHHTGSGLRAEESAGLNLPGMDCSAKPQQYGPGCEKRAQSRTTSLITTV